MSELQDLIDRFQSFRANSRAHADIFLRNGYLHPEADHVIQAWVGQFVRRLEVGGPALLEEVLRAIGEEAAA